MNNYKRRVTIFGLPKDWSVYRLHSELNKYTKEWNVVDIVPLVQDLIVYINCKSAESYECFMNLAQIMPYPYHNLRAYSGTAKWNFPQPRNLQASANIFDVNLDCLIVIFERCTLGEQIVLAKTCYYFYKIIVSIWKRKFSALFFSFSRVFDYHKLKDEQVWDFCMLVGRYLKFMIIDSLNDYKTMNCYTKGLYWEGDLRCSVSMKIRRHLVHFPHLEILQIEGIFLADEVLYELARCCPKIRELQFVDPLTFFTTGEHFSSFRNLEVIDICAGMRCRLVEMLKVCHQLHLKKLNMVDTRRLYEPDFFSTLVKTQFATLTTLWLSAIKDKDTILLILKLPLLVELKFYWNRTYEGFENILFSALSETRQNSLHSVSFEVHDLPYEMLSFRYFDVAKPRYHRRVLHGIRDGWELHESTFQEFLKLLDVCISLEKLVIRYCALFGEKNIFIFPEHCESLRLIQIIGQCRKYDDKFLDKWQGREDCSCELRIEGELLYFTEQEIILGLRQNRKVFSYRSIECNFKNPLLEKINANDR